MRAFEHEAPAQRVRFGPGRALELADEVERLGLERVLLIAGGSASAVGDALEERLGPRVARRWQRVLEHVPATLVTAVRGAADGAGVDGVACIGGGSAIGLGKAVVVGTARPLLVVPTTYSGSEMTPIYGITGARKRTSRDAGVVPRAVVYDPELTVGLPRRVSAASACNALAHAVEGLYGTGANPITDVLAVEAIRRIAAALPRVVDAPGDLEARGDLLLGAHLAGAVLACVSMGLHHRACHVLGGTYGVGHAEVHAVLLPHVVALQATREPDAIAKLATALGVRRPARALHDLGVAAGAPASLKALGLAEADLAPAAHAVALELGPAPDLGPPELEALLRRAWAGDRP